MCFFPFPALVFPKNREIPGNSREVIFGNSQTGTTLLGIDSFPKPCLSLLSRNAHTLIIAYKTRLMCMLCCAVLRLCLCAVLCVVCSPHSALHNTHHGREDLLIFVLKWWLFHSSVDSISRTDIDSDPAFNYKSHSLAGLSRLRSEQDIPHYMKQA